MVEGINWKPLHPQAAAARKLSTTWSFGGAIVAGVVFVLGFVAAGLTDGISGGLVALLGAVAGGVVLVSAGLGMLQLEALRAESVTIPTGDGPDRRSLTDGAALDPALLKELRQGLAGLTAARAAIFAGAFLLAVAAIGGGISLAGGEEDDDSEGPAPSPTVTQTS